MSSISTRTAIPIPTPEIEEFCRHFEVQELALFGSVLRDDFRPDSDVDVLVTFEPNARATLWTLGQMKLELEKIFQREVDVVERRGVEQSPNWIRRNSILGSLKVIYARRPRASA
jgi:predicted nucleotidyltransferase